jgi:hypothetical protein
VIRGLRVMIDVDLAALYGVETKLLNEQVKRNRERFPADFLFQLTAAEKASRNSNFLRHLVFRSASLAGADTLPFVIGDVGARVSAAGLHLRANPVVVLGSAGSMLLRAVLHVLKPPGDAAPARSHQRR